MEIADQHGKVRQSRCATERVEKSGERGLGGERKGTRRQDCPKSHADQSLDDRAGTASFAGLGGIELEPVYGDAVIVRKE